MKKQNKTWQDKFREEFGIHFRDSKSELEFAIAFIEDLLKAVKEEKKQLKSK